MKSLTSRCNDGLAYVEDMLLKQLIHAIGTEVGNKAFGDFMRFHNTKLFWPDFAPRSFTYAIRRPGR